jgi:hypothetical protein
MAAGVLRVALGAAVLQDGRAFPAQRGARADLPRLIVDSPLGGRFQRALILGCSASDTAGAVVIERP